ncbi:MAG: hypothetical protein KGM42_11010 [Hyphomicrobiales bacterium]|nr:hypothetical protein [Hyphomicrobiales bacterium]
MLSRFDDYPIHQTPEPIAHPATTDRNVYDRYWFNGYSADGAYYFGIALGLYPARGVMDCAFSLVRAGQQTSFHASRRVPADRDELQVGPFRIEVIEPMRKLRVTLAPNETKLSCNLLFEPTTACIEEDRQVLRREKRVFMDVTRFTQFGCWSGEIRCGDDRIDVLRENSFATRDRSWGVRPVGEPETGGAPAKAAPQIFFLWAPMHWDDTCTHVGFFEDSSGRQWHGEGKIAPRYTRAELIPGVEDPALQRMTGAAHKLVYAPGTRRAKSGEIFMMDATGERTAIAFEPLLTFRMKGLGYGHPQWRHGLWKGELAIEGEQWACDALDPLAPDNIHIQQLVRARMGDKTGVGIVEQLCLGPHAPSGFTAMLDGAK